MDTLMSVHIVLDCKLPWLDACGCSVDVIIGPFKWKRAGGEDDSVN